MDSEVMFPTRGSTFFEHRESSIVPPSRRKHFHKIVTKHKGVVGQIISAVLSSFLILMSFLTTPAVLFKGEMSFYLPIAMIQGAIGNFMVQFIFTSIGKYNSSVVRLSSESLPMLITVVDALLKENMDVKAKVATLLWACAFVSIYTAIIAIVISVLKLGSLLNYLPIPVRAGVFGAIGVVFYTSAYSVAYGEDISTRVFTHFNLAMVFLLNLIGLFTYVMSAWKPHPLTVPATFLLGTVIFHIVRASIGASMAVAQDNTWLMPQPKFEIFYSLYTTMDPRIVNFKFIFAQTPNLLLAALLGPVLNTGINTIVLDKMYDDESDLDKALRHLGIGNLLGGLCGGFPSFQYISATSIHRTCGGTTRISTILICIVMLVTFFYPQILLAIIVIPRFLLGAIFIHISVDFLVSAIYFDFFEVNLIEYVIILIMVVVCAVQDVTIALLVGVVICFVLYIYNTAHSDYISMESDNSAISSNILQTLDKDLFRHSKQMIKVFKLAGYIFFAPSYEIKEKIIKQVTVFNSMNYKQITHVVVDFTICTGIDTTATNVIIDMVEKLASIGVHVGLVFANQKRRAEITKLVKQRKGLKTKEQFCSLYSTLEQALSDCELQIDIPTVTVTSPRGETFTNVHLQNLSLFVKMLHGLKGQKVRNSLIRAFQLGVGKLEWVEEKDLVYREFERADGVYFLCYGRLTAIILESINMRISTFNKQDDDTRDLKRLWTVNEVGSLLGNMLERKGISYTTETIIADRHSMLYHITEEGLRHFEKLDDKSYTIIAQWENDLRYRKIKFLIERVKISRQFILS